MTTTARAMTYLLVPGAGGDGAYWYRVVQGLQARGHTAIPVDLPAADVNADLATYADRIVAAGGGHDRLVVVAQSMGSLAAVLACTRLPVELLVLLNAMIPLPGETGAQWWEATGQAAAAEAFAASEGRVLADDLDPVEVFFHDVPPEVLEQVTAQGQPAQSGTPFAQPFPLTQWPQVATRVLASTGDRLFPAAFQRRVAHERLGVATDEIPGGHLVALSQPAAVVARLEQYASATAAEPAPVVRWSSSAKR